MAVTAAFAAATTAVVAVAAGLGHDRGGSVEWTGSGAVQAALLAAPTDERGANAKMDFDVGLMYGE